MIPYWAKLNSLADPASTAESSAMRQPVQNTTSSSSITERPRENLKVGEEKILERKHPKMTIIPLSS